MLILKNKASKEDIEKVVKHFQGYIKVVVDIEREILCAGADRHVDEEKMLLDDGSKQNNLWGGGIDTSTNEIDYNSMINLRPNQDNPSRDIMAKDVRLEFDKIVRNLIK